MKQTAAFTLLLSCLACGGGGSGTAPSPTPQPTTFTLSGSVTEPAPTLTTAIAGATVTVIDGPNANTAATTDGSGRYTLNLSSGGFTVRITKTGYEDTSLPVTLSANQSLNVQLTPTFNQMHLTGSDSVSGGDTCGLSYSDGCKGYVINVYHDGNVDFALTWTDDDTWLWLELYSDNGNQLSSSDQTRSSGLKQHISSTVTKGHAYFIVVRYALGARTTPFTLTSSWPQLH